MKGRITTLLVAVGLAVGLCAPAAAAGIGEPRLQYTYGGAYSSGWIEESYTATPAVADLDGDGNNEIIFAIYTIYCADAATGQIKWQTGSGHDVTETEATYEGRVWADPVVADVDGDGQLEIVVGNSVGVLAVYDASGRFETGWPQQVTTHMEIKSVRVADLDGDGTSEIVCAVGDPESGEPQVNVWVYEHDGSIRPGWPQYQAEAGQAVTAYSWGVYNDGLEIADLTGDGVDEIIVPSDVPYICVYDRDGNLLPVNGAVFSKDGHGNWGGTAVWQSYLFEKLQENKGWGLTADPFTGYAWIMEALPQYRRNTANFLYGRAEVADLDGNGANEMVIVGRIYDRVKGFPERDNPSLFNGLFIFNGDRTRFVSDRGESWEDIPISGAPLNEDWDISQICMPDPTLADLDGDGRMEILYASYDGKLNCYWLDKEQKHGWPLSVYDGVTVEFASPPAVKDLDGDGCQEVIFTTFTALAGEKNGSLYVCNYKGEVLHRVELPESLNDPKTNGSSCGPVVEDVDGDGILEVVFTGYLSGLTVYELPVGGN